jgi:hypothetical protein
MTLRSIDEEDKNHVRQQQKVGHELGNGQNLVQYEAKFGCELDLVKLAREPVAAVHGPQRSTMVAGW